LVAKIVWQIVIRMEKTIIYKRFTFYIFLIGIVGCGPSMSTHAGNVPLPKSQIEKQNQIVMQAQQINFLEGKWIRTDDKDELQTYENWKRITPIEYEAYSYSKKEGKIVWEETSTLKLYNEKLTLKVKILDGKPVKFNCSTKVNDKYLVCTNSKNDYPKQIEYWMDKDTLKAKISGGGPNVAFTFIKNRSVE